MIVDNFTELPSVQISTPMPSQHNGQRLPPGLLSYQPAHDCLAMAQDMRV